MKSIQIVCLFSFSALILTLTGCGEQVHRNKLTGKTYEVEDVAIYEGTNIATWRNTHADEDFGEGDLALNIASSSGSFEFSDDGDVDIMVEFSWLGGDGDTYESTHVNQGGELVMDGRQDWFDVEGGTHGYTQYFIEEKNGKELTITWEQLFGQYGFVYVFKVKR